jgi:hypothetical protein
MLKTSFDRHTHWIHNDVSADNTVHCGWFLKEFTIAKSIYEVLLHITTDSRYKLFVDKEYGDQVLIRCNANC